MSANKKNNDEWWASLTVSQKERIAKKIAKQDVRYPDCTDVWNNLPEDKKNSVREHCEDSHGYFIKEWVDGDPYGD